jgi:hypothetical protein
MIGNQVTSKSGQGTVSPELCRFDVPFNFLCAQIGQHHPDNPALPPVSGGISRETAMPDSGERFGLNPVANSEH